MNIKAWLVTGSRMWHDAVCLNEASADVRIAARNSDGDRKVPLVDADELSRAYALIEEMRERLVRIAEDKNYFLQNNEHPLLETIERASAFLAERVK